MMLGVELGDGRAPEPEELHDPDYRERQHDEGYEGPRPRFWDSDLSCHN